MPSIDSITGTLLTLDIPGIAPYSTRGATQVIQPIDQAKNIARTINGRAVDQSWDQFRKFITKISCKDQMSPALDGVWPGLQVTIGCCIELSYKVGSTRQRPAVSGSERTISGYKFYLPVITVLITSWQSSFDEWGHEYTWSLEGEEL